MKRLCLPLLAIACSSCAKDHEKPPADLNFISVERKADLSLYIVRYKSNINLLDLYARGMGEGIASAQFICALDGDHDFSVEHEIARSAYGRIQADAAQTNQPPSNFFTEAFLSETLDKGQSRRDISVEELNTLLANKKTIPCKALITAYGYKTYYSNTLQLPVADLLREINKPTAP